MSTTFLQQILSGRLLLVVIIRAKKIILVLVSNLNQPVIYCKNVIDVASLGFD